MHGYATDMRPLSLYQRAVWSSQSMLGERIFDKHTCHTNHYISFFYNWEESSRDVCTVHTSEKVQV